MQFTCQRSGKCCTHPQIVITLTHEDIWILFQHAQDLAELTRFIQFIVLEKQEDLKKLVLQSVRTTEGNGIFILRKDANNKCIFYNVSTSSCQIHNIRPQACRNFPFAFREDGTKVRVSLVKNASSFCEGIGKGKNYDEKTLEKIGRHTLDQIKRYNEIVAEINKEAHKEKPLTPHDALATLLLVAQKEQAEIQEELQIL